MKNNMIVIITTESELRELIGNKVDNIKDKFAMPVISFSDTQYGDVEFASQLTGYSKSRIYRLVNDDKIPYSEPNGKLIFSKIALEDWMKGES